MSCTCCYNQSLKCKHVAALIYYINNEESLTKTDCEQQWGAPSAQQFAKKKYSKGKYFFEMFPPDNELADIQPFGVDLSELQSPSALKIMLTSIANRRVRESQEEQSGLIDVPDSQVVSADASEKRTCQENLKLLFSLWDDSEIDYTPVAIPQELTQFYNKYIVMTVQQIIDLCCDTIQQSDSSEWFKARRYRISASKNAHSIKSRKSKTIPKLIEEMLFSKNINTEALRYGKEMESVARKEYEKENNIIVEQVGVIVCQKKPWLCASLDGVVIENLLPTRVVEIKCPFKCKNVPIVDNVLQKCNVGYLEIKNNNVQLRRSAIIYTQCQIQMYVSGIALCHLYVYSPVQSCTVTVHRDNEFLKQVLLQCENFYFEHYLIALKDTIEKEIERSSKIKTRNFTGQDVSNLLKLF